MPELPEVETVRRGLSKAWVGRTIQGVELRRENLRFPFPPDLDIKLVDRTIRNIRRRAKYLLIDLDNGSVILSHLGMSGRWTLDAADSSGKHDHVVFHLDDDTISVYTDPRRFGVLDLFDGKSHKLLDHLGPEPLDDWTGECLYHAISGRKSAIKTLILDQKIVVGVGNIYACEALHRVGIDPTRKGCDVSLEECKMLAIQIRDTLRDAIAAGGSTLKDFAATDGALGYFPHQFRVYDKEGEECSCGAIIERMVQTGRSTFWCSSCQK